MSIKKLSLAGILIAMGVVCSAFYIPIGIAKCFPVQHAINVVASVVLGPFYAVSMAFVTSLIRVMMGTGSLLAFPGSMCGALLCSMLYKYTKRFEMAYVGELIGTGIFGAILSYPIATIFLEKEAVLFGFVIPFGLSSFAGVTIAIVIIMSMKKTGVLSKLKLEEQCEN